MIQGPEQLISRFKLHSEVILVFMKLSDALEKDDIPARYIRGIE